MPPDKESPGARTGAAGASGVVVAGERDSSKINRFGVNSQALAELAAEINVRLRKADDHRLSAALKLEEARQACRAAGLDFKSWVGREIRLSYSEAVRLARIGASDDPAKALADLRERKARAAKVRREQPVVPRSTTALPAPTDQAEGPPQEDLVIQLREAVAKFVREVDDDLKEEGGSYGLEDFILALRAGETYEAEAALPLVAQLLGLPADPWPGLTGARLEALTKGRLREANRLGLTSPGGDFELEYLRKLRAARHRDWLMQGSAR